ncbi:MAG: NAD-dependent epimerase/dehydratase family protein [Myxococcota bacterium]|nr:NAD-dependent epimerase/dehydratase family protein [Myxococcota bacterium]
MRALVTGAGGFLGAAITRQLLDADWSVRGFARGDYPALEKLGVDMRRGDLADETAVQQAAEGVDVVFHVAALPGVWGSRDLYYRTNTVGTLNVINACRQHGVSKLVYTSTPSVVHAGGNIEGADESLPYPERYATHYPETKALAERAVLAANDDTLATIALRPHLIWGPGDNHLVPRILARADQGRLRFVGRPSALVDSCFIDDAARAHRLAADALAPGASCAGRAYFISQGEPWPTDALINGILNAAGRPPVSRYISARLAWWIGLACELVYTVLRRSAEPPMTRFVAEQLSTAHWYDISAAARDFGFQPKYSIEAGLEALAESFNSGNKPGK